MPCDPHYLRGVELERYDHWRTLQDEPRYPVTEEEWRCLWQQSQGTHA